MKLTRYDFLRSSVFIAGAALLNLTGCAADAGESLPRGKRTTDLDDDDPSGAGSTGGGSGTSKSGGSKGGNTGSGGGSQPSSYGGSQSGKGGGTGNNDPGSGQGEGGGSGSTNSSKGGSTGSSGSTGSAGDTSSGGDECNRVVSTIGTNHGHVLVVAVSDVEAGEERTYDITGTSSHPHEVVVTAEHFADLAAGKTVIIESDGASHTHSVQLKCG